jgi:hypothetical protein
MGSNCPLHKAQPFGAKTNDMILISLKNGSAISKSPSVNKALLRKLVRAGD